MPNSIENRVVNLDFRNENFEQKASKSIGTLENLKGKLNFDGSRKSAEDLQNAIGRFNFGGLTSGISSVTSGFSAMSVVGVTALATIVSKAVSAGLDIAKALTIQPAIDGLREYETNLNSIQTVLANTSSKGTNLQDVNSALEELNEYSDKTIYNFAEMAKNIGTFTAAGVDLDTSVASIKGIANLAAVSGSNSQQASTAMYQLSQALAAGKVSLMDWNSVVNAGMGGQVFQDSLKETARAMGKDVDGIIKEAGSFRDSLESGWITSDVLNQTLMKFTGDLNAEQLKAQGYNEEQIASIIKMGETATDAATKVKTFSQLQGTLQEAVGSGWAKTFQIVVGDFEQAKDFFTGVNDVLSGSIGASADARNALLQGWSDLGGRQALIEAFWYALDSGMAIINAVKKAFRDVFPPATAESLVKLTERFRDFLKGINDGTKNLEPFTRILRGVFAAIGIGIQFVKAFVGFIFRLVDSLNLSGGSLLEWLGTLSDWLVKMKTSGDAAYKFEQFFEEVSYKILAAIDWLKEFGATIKQVFVDSGFGAFAKNLFSVFKQIVTGGLDIEKVRELFAQFSEVMGKLGENIKQQLAPLREAFNTVFGGAAQWFQDVKTYFTPLAELIKEQMLRIKDAIFGGFTDGDFSSLLAVLSTGFLGVIVAAVRKIIKDGISFDLSGGLFDSVKDSLDGLTGTLTAMQTNLKADTLLKIAGAIGILTLAVIALSNIDPEKLAKAMAGLAVGMGQLIGAMALMSLIGNGLGFVKLPVIAAGMVLLAGAAALLSVAVKSMADLDWEDLGRGMSGVAAGLTLMTASMMLLSGSSGGILRASLAMIPLAKGMRLLADAVREFSLMNWNDLSRGMAGLAVGLGVITLALRNMPPNVRANALGLVIIAAALKVLAIALKDFGGIPWDIMARGMAGIAASLTVITAALRLMPKNIMGQAAGLLAISVAMNILAKALSSMGGMSWEEIGKGMATLAGSLGILALALNLMTGTVGAALALTAVVTALAMFVPVMIALGSLPWPVILTALGALAAVFVVIGVAGLLLSPLTPILLALSVAMGIFGLAVLALGTGALLAATAIGILVAAGAAGMTVLFQVIQTLIANIPTLLVAVAEGLINMVKVIGENAPTIIDAMKKIAIGILDALIDLAPKAAEAMGVVISELLGVLSDNVPKIVQAGFDLLLGLLQGIADNIGDVVDTVTEIITEFLGALEDSIPEIIQAGWDLLIALVDGMAKSVSSNISRLMTAGGELVQAIVDGFINGLGSLAGYVRDKAMAFFSGIWNSVKDFFGIASPSKRFFWVGEMLMTGLADGIDYKGKRAVTAAESVSEDVMSSMSKTIGQIPNLFSGVTDIRPTITPVLDLAGVRTEAGKLDGMLQTQSITPTAALGQARAISRSQMALAETAAAASEPVARQLVFTQQNNSPEALSTVDIYRDTMSLLSQAQRGLNV